VNYCDALEKQYAEAKREGMFDALKVLELDESHSDTHLVRAVNYFKKHDGSITEDAPMNHLTEREKSIVNEGEKFRAKLYCMLLTIKFAEAIENKSAFIKHSYRYSSDAGAIEI